MDDRRVIRKGEATPVAGVTNGARTCWWESPAFLAFVVFATMLPLLYPPIPPLVDLFGHIGRYRVEPTSITRAGFSNISTITGRSSETSGWMCLVLVLALLVGLNPRLKSSCWQPAAYGHRIPLVAREVHGRIPPTAFFALPPIYGFPFLFGFVTCALSVAFAFLASGLWLRLGLIVALRGWLFVPISLIVFFTHTYGWGLLGLMCFSADAVRLHDRGRQWWRAGIEAALHTSVMALPLIVMLIWRSETHGGQTTSWFERKAKWRWIYSALRDRWKLLDIASLVVPGLVFLYAIFSRKLTLSRNLAFSAIVLAVCFVMVPRIVFGSAYADMRLVPYLMAVALLAIRFRGAPDRTTAQVLAVLALLFFATRSAANPSRWMAAVDQKESYSARSCPGRRGSLRSPARCATNIADAAQ
jgi:hypothetical protein